MANRWESAPAVEQAPKWASAPAVQDAAPSKPRPSNAAIAGEFGKGLIVDPVVGAVQTGMNTTTAAGNIKNVRDIAAAHGRQIDRARTSWEKKRYLEGLGDAILAAVPVIGPAVGDVVENFTEGVANDDPLQQARAAGNATSMLVGPKVASKAPAMVRAVADSAPVTVARGMGKGAARIAPEVARSAVEGIPIVGKPIMKGVDAALEGAKKELMARKVRQAQRDGSRTPPTWQQQPPPLPAQAVDAAPIPGNLPSGRVPGQPQPRPGRPAPVWQDIPTERPIPPQMAPMTDLPDLPSGRRPMTAGERLRRYGQPSEETVVSGPPSQPGPVVPDGPMSRLNPEQLQNAQQLAAEFNPPAGPPEIPVQYEAGARATKTWNLADFMHEHGFTSDLIEYAPQGIRESITQQLNRAREAEMPVGEVLKNRHQPPSQKTWAEVVRELKEIEARKATGQ